MYAMLTRALGMLVAGLTSAVVTLARKCAQIADWCIRQLIWLIQRLQSALKSLCVKILQWIDRSIIQLLRAQWLLESSFARGGARSLHLLYLVLKVAAFYSPAFAGLYAYYSLQNTILFLIGMGWATLVTSLLVVFLFSSQKDTAKIVLPDLAWIEWPLRYAFRFGPAMSFIGYCYKFQLEPYWYAIGGVWLISGLLFGHFSDTNHRQFGSLTEFIDDVINAPLDAQAYIRGARKHRDRGNFDKEIDSLSKAIELDPQNAWAYYKRGQAHRFKGNLDKAIHDFTKTIDLIPGDVQAYAERGGTYRLMRNLAAAINDFTKVIQLNPKDIISRTTLLDLQRELNPEEIVSREIQSPSSFPVTA